MKTIRKSWPIGILTLLLSSTVFAAESENYDAAAGYQATCFACHGTGQAHAPEIGDVIEWEIRSEKGFDTLVQNTINGLNGIMPPRGLCADCTDNQLRAIVEYMLEESK
ncbi:MAG: cytochrome c5 family protein [Pseudomonadales bacterium]|nr:cytochrome c5 family protein [Pseudomonadales bacterium]